MCSIVFSVLSVLASGVATATPLEREGHSYAQRTEIDFEDGLEISAPILRPMVLHIERSATRFQPQCTAVLEQGLPALPDARDLTSRSGRRKLRAASRQDGLDDTDTELVLAKAHACFAWQHDDEQRTTIGLYATFLSDTDIGYCRKHFSGHTSSGDPDERRTVLDDATATIEYCLVDADTPPMSRNPHEMAQTALSEAKLGTFLPGGAAGDLYRRVNRRIEISPERFLEVLRELDASGAPAAAFMTGDGKAPWTAGQLAREAALRLADPS